MTFRGNYFSHIFALAVCCTAVGWAANEGTSAKEVRDHQPSEIYIVIIEGFPVLPPSEIETAIATHVLPNVVTIEQENSPFIPSAVLELDEILDVTSLAVVPACPGSQFSTVHMDEDRLPWNIYTEDQNSIREFGNYDWNEFTKRLLIANDPDNFLTIPKNGKDYFVPRPVIVFDLVEKRLIISSK